MKKHLVAMNAFIFALFGCSIIIASGNESNLGSEKLNLFYNEKGVEWSVSNKYGKIGMRGHISVDQALPTRRCSSDAVLCQEDDKRRVEMRLDDSCLYISTEATDPTDELRDCIDLGDAHWFGGPEQYNQYWPVEKLTSDDYSYITKENNNMAVVERYWLNSYGTYIYVDSSVPLFVNQNNYRENSLCFIARNRDPYLSTRPTLSLQYSICGLSQADAKAAHYDAIERFLNKPTGVIDERMVRHPIWSTWARYKAGISQETVLEFANEILNNGFNNSQMEIDDKWETCYGSLIFDTSASKFPDMRSLSLTLKSLGFRVTLWIHPFVNVDCEPHFSFASSNNYLIKDTNGNVEGGWWNGRGASVDFTNPDAITWWVDKLNLLIENELIDSYKFDAGETSWPPQVPVLNAPLEDQPGILSVKYAETCAQFGDFIEVRVGYKTQHLPIFVRMLDKDSRWGYNNGLKTLVTTLLQMNMVGYPYVLPDMIGGNGYSDGKPTKELFLRWLQANTFMPSLQFSFVPWDFDQEAVDISHKFTLLHDQYTDVIMEAAAKAVVDGSPINPPIWWIAPEDVTAQAIDDEYLLGETVLVAPVLVEGATTRDIYLPEGVWRDNVAQQDIVGPIWLRAYPAPLDTLPYFTRLSARHTKA